jgi:hypothetical protein
MKKITALIVLVLATIPASAATDDKKAKKTTKSAGSAAKKTEPLTVPKDASDNGDGTYNYTDKQGKKWVYVKTPFGVTRSPAADSAGSSPFGSAPTAVQTKATDKGDVVRFEQPTPFGTRTWEKKKSDLTDDERRILDGQQASPSK